MIDLLFWIYVISACLNGLYWFVIIPVYVEARLSIPAYGLGILTIVAPVYNTYWALQWLWGLWKLVREWRWK